jgi:hypothetical protein
MNQEEINRECRLFSERNSSMLSYIPNYHFYFRNSDFGEKGLTLSDDKLLVALAERCAEDIPRKLKSAMNRRGATLEQLTGGRPSPNLCQLWPGDYED